MDEVNHFRSRNEEEPHLVNTAADNLSLFE
jgi:hypothetical protein